MTEHKYASVPGKDTVYVDVDDEITVIIDKLRGSPQKIVALVLPKRATVLQSIVNMKLLKRTADEAKKQLVLITSEASLLPLAGSVGLYVAKNLQSKPEVPHVPGSNGVDPTEEEPLLMDDEQAGDAPLDGSKSIGELAAAKGGAMAVDETIDLDADDAPAAKKGKKVGGKLKVPNFDKFRLTLILGVLGIFLLIGAWILCFNVLPKSTIVVKTNASEITSELSLTLNTAAPALDEKTAVLPAQIQQTQKQSAQQVPATGQRDEGTKATGKVTIKNCGASEITIPAGTAVSAGGQTFITQSRLDLDDGKFGGVCKPAGEHIATVDVVAQNAGAQYNLDARSDYKVAGQDSSVTANGTAMSGGTSNVVKIVSQADIDGAKQKITAQDTAAVKQELQAALQKAGLFAIGTTFKANDPAVTTSANPGDKAENVTVNATVVYMMFGAKREDVEKLVANDVNKHIDTKKQTLLQNGALNGNFVVQGQDATKAVIALSASSIAGPDLKVDALKKQVAGKKARNAQDIIKANPGVTDVTVKYSPFWVSSIPDNPGKITIIIEKPAKDGR